MLQDWQEAESKIFVGLCKLTTAGGPGNFMIVSCGDCYVQCAGSRGSPKVHCEAIGNEFLSKPLAPERVNELERLGFDLQDQPPNYTREFRLAGEEQAHELARLMLAILEKIYGCVRDSELEIELNLE